MFNTINMPKELTAENGAKELLSGEFYSEVVIECEECGGLGHDQDLQECNDCYGGGTITQITSDF